ncbi:MAG: ketopantoate reductase family protein [Gemmatimonadota bacterium]
MSQPIDSVCVVGAGAVGGLVGGRLIDAGVDVTLVDRGEQLEALRQGGLTLIGADGSRTRFPDVDATGDTGEAGVHDLVVLSVKAYDLPGAARSLPPLLGPDTVVLPLQNGIPWWYFHAHPEGYEDRDLEALDPDGVIRDHVPGGRVVGCVAYVAASVVEPGVVHHREGGSLPVGDPDGSRSARAAAVSELLGAAGFRSRVLEDIRSEIWLKAWGSLAFNPLSALTGATLEEICRHPQTRTLVRDMMEEARPVAEDLGASFRRSVDRRIDGAESVGAHRTSMLQDLEAGRRLEVEALVGSVLELARLTGRPAPRIEAVYAATKLLDDRR